MSLLEVLLVLAVAAILTAWAYPSFSLARHQARRSEAWIGFHQIQLAQARYRNQHAQFGSLQDIGWQAQTASSNYRWQIDDHNERGYTVSATAQGPQTSDSPCQYLEMQWMGFQQVRRSGPSRHALNSEPESDRCWMQ